jgi:antiviral helicase SKI2
MYDNNKNEIKNVTPKKINFNDKDNDKEIENETNEDDNSSNNDSEENENNDINDEDNNIDEAYCNNNEKNERQQKKDRTLFETVNYILNKKLYPATLFIFNIRKINEYSTRIIKECSLPELPSSEKTRINNFFQKIINSLPVQDQKINQINYLQNLLQYGIGVHHSGLLPILKEIIEILYSKGLIKILIATTSFSIGLNMPTKTVVFLSLYKYNENRSQILSSSEFLQMSGRAGRRGIDVSGNVYILCFEPLGKNQIKKIKDLLKGEGNDLESKFRLSYRIILSFYHAPSFFFKAVCVNGNLISPL